MITVRLAWLGITIAAVLALLAGAAVERLFQPERPEFVPALTPATAAPAVTWSGQGAWRVPGQVAPGLYNVFAGDRECVWQRRKNFSGAKTTVLEAGVVPPRTSRRVLVYPTDRVFVTMGPCEWERTA